MNPAHASVLAVLLLVTFVALAQAQEAALPTMTRDERVKPAGDWLLNGAPFKARVLRSEDQKEIILTNGLVRRVFRLAPNGATVALDNMMTGQNELRSVRPEAVVELNGQRYDVGGLIGQPVHNYLKTEWLETMRANPAALAFAGFETVAVKERFAWKKRREWMPADLPWPPPGAGLTLTFKASEQMVKGLRTDGPRQALLEDRFEKPDAEWKVHASKASDRSSFQNEGKAGEIYGYENTAIYAERKLPAGTQAVQCRLNPGTDKSASWGPGMTVVWPNRVVKFFLRTGQGVLGVTDNGGEAMLAKCEEGKSVWLRLTAQPAALVFDISSDGQKWTRVHQTALREPLGDPTAVRLGKTSKSGGNDDFGEKGELMRCRVEEFTAWGDLLPDKADVGARPVVAETTVRVHYEMYDGIPLLAKWISVTNSGKEPVTLNSFISEIIAAVEAESPVDLRNPAMFRHDLQNFVVDSDFSFQSMDRYSQHHAIHWKSDPLYETQVNYARQTPCLLECHPPSGPDAVVKPGETFESFRVFELFFDGEDRERRGLAVRRMYRTLAPWVTENPTLMHVRSADPKAVRLAVDQCAEAGFEMVIMTFGSGFNIENESPKYLEQLKELADYAHSKGIALGGYSLLASRGVSAEDDVCNPATGKPGGFAVFGNSPCLGSKWGQDYFRKLYQFFEKTGADILEHDGSYPGDVCASVKHPGHRGLRDSQWRQWRTIAELYQWCRARGVYLNVPDFYYLAGSSKCGMGYRETNWSLPRAEQEIIERQNIWDGTWEKTPSMGWMFVPLTQYHGGGAAATIEPLAEHLDHYETRLANLFGAGVKACYRGPRLYDTDATKAVVKKWVDWYKKYRAILDSDIIHGRRADGRDVDWIMHANPNLKERGLVVVYNPLPQHVERTLTLPLYLTGLTDKAQIRREEGTPQSYTLTRDYKVTVAIKVPARGRTWLVIEAP